MRVGIVMGSISDRPVVQGAADLLKRFGVEVTMRALSAHRTPDEVAEFAKGAKEAGIEVIIAAAGKAAALPGCIAAHTTLPVIGLPVRSSLMDGLDSLLSMVQMPSGVPVATVAVGGADNAALLAVGILAIKYPQLDQALTEYRRALAEKSLAADAALQAE